MTDIGNVKWRSTALLFHGPPSVGKSVRSSLAFVTAQRCLRQALLLINVAEIGLNAALAERNLEKYYNLAAKWDAILLVDEADFFFGGSSSEIGRNALVTGMLRVLEYVPGIIILTTNRIEEVDVAVLSRINLAIRYEDLTVM